MRIPPLIVSLLVLASCDKGNTADIGGKGGNAILKVNLKHHSVASHIINAIVYIKYNTLEKPANDIYDDSAVATHAIYDTMQTAIFTGLKKGDYFLYGKGYDTSVSHPVLSGYHYSITSETSQVFDLAVSE